MSFQAANNNGLLLLALWLSSPNLCLFDEPTSALDPELRHEVLRVMQDLAEEGMTMIVVTQRKWHLRQVGHRMIFMEGGKIAADGPPEELIKNPANARLQSFYSM